MLIKVISVLTYKDTGGGGGWQNFYRTGRGTVDVMFFGNSHVHCTVDHGLLWDNYGIAGYTLVSGSTGMRIIAHEPFTSTEEAIANDEDIHSTIDIQETINKRITIASTDKGKELQSQINDLIELINAYEKGLIHENKEFIYKKVKKIQK